MAENKIVFCLAWFCTQGTSNFNLLCRKNCLHQSGRWTSGKRYCTCAAWKWFQLYTRPKWPFSVKSLKYQAKSLKWWFYLGRKERKYLHKTCWPLHGLRVVYCLVAFKLQRTGCFLAAHFALVIIIWKSLMILISFSTLLDFSSRVTLQYLVLIFMMARVLILISADIFFDTKIWGWVTAKANWGLRKANFMFYKYCRCLLIGWSLGWWVPWITSAPLCGVD